MSKFKQAKWDRAMRNFRRVDLLTERSSSKRSRTAIKWARVLDRMAVSPGGPLFFLRSLGETPH